MNQEANARVQAAIDRAISERGELGVQVAAYLNGELVVDAWGGVADWETNTNVDADTIFTVFSATKGVAATALHMQAERGLIDYDTPIVKYWPEFAPHGKDRVTPRDALIHSIGVPLMPEGCTAEQMCDWDWMCNAIANMEPSWEPGTKHGYHAYTYGWIVGELVRRTDPKARPFGQYIQDEINAPLGIDSLWMGIPDEVESRVARLKNIVPPPPPPPGEAPAFIPSPLLAKSIPVDLGTNQETFGRPDVRRACIPGAGGIMNARSLARHYAMHGNGGELDGVRLLSRSRIDEICTLQSDAPDEVISAPYRRGMGFWLGGEPLSGNTAVFGLNSRSYGHPGAGGSIGWCDPDTGLGAAIIHNKMGGGPTPADNPLVAIADTIRAALNIPG